MDPGRGRASARSEVSVVLRQRRAQQAGDLLTGSRLRSEGSDKKCILNGVYASPHCLLGFSRWQGSAFCRCVLQVKMFLGKRRSLVLLTVASGPETLVNACPTAWRGPCPLRSAVSRAVAAAHSRAAAPGPRSALPPLPPNLSRASPPPPWSSLLDPGHGLSEPLGSWPCTRTSLQASFRQSRPRTRHHVARRRCWTTELASLAQAFVMKDRVVIMIRVASVGGSWL